MPGNHPFASVRAASFSALNYLGLAMAGIGNLPAADYHVDPAGNDSNSGTSPATPWQSLAKVNGTVFQPGDKVLFKRGGTWVGTLSPQGSGNSSARITLGSYGEGAKPLINGNGNWAVITLSSQSYWTIDGFEVTNPAGNDSSRSGIRVDWSGSGTMQGIEILNNDVRDVRGIKNVNDGGRNNGGIFFWINEPGKADGVLIQGNTVKNIHGQGIAFNAEAEYMGGGMNYANCSPNVVARGNTVLTTSGDGILMLGTDNELVEHNEVGYVGQLSDWYNNIAAAWPTRHVGGLWQYNEVHNTAALNANDSTAFDNDGFVKGTTVFQYNVTYNNAGGFLMEYTWGGDDPSARTVARYNISWNESRILATNRNNARIYNNVFYNPGATIDVSWTPNPSYVLFSNNLFVAAGRTTDFSRQLFMNNNFSGGVSRPTTQDGNRTQDPQFISPNTTGNLAGFILQSTSPVRNTGFIIDGIQGKDFWGVTLPATSPHRGASQISSIANYAATPSFMRIEGASSVEIPASGTNTAALIPIVRDQNFRRISNAPVTWSVSPTVAGVSIDSNGSLSVASNALPRRIAIQASSGGASNTYSVALFTNQPVSHTWGGGNGSWTDTSTAGWNGGPPLADDHASIHGGSVDVNVAGVGNLGSLTLSGGVLNVYNFIAGINTYAAYNNLTLQGGTLHGNGSYNNWGAGILGTQMVSGTTASTISASSFFNLNGTGSNSSVFNVADVTGDASADLIVSARLADASANQSWSPAALVKSGAGTMRLAIVNTYSGGTTVEQGTLELAGAVAGTGIINGSVTVNAGATIALTGGDGTGFGWSNTINNLNIQGGAVNASGGSHLGFGAYANVLLANGGTISGNWQWNGDNLLGFSSSGDATNTINGSLNLRSDAGANHRFNVADGNSATDLQVNANLGDQYPEVGWLAASNLIKSGNGSMVLAGTNSYDGQTDIQSGMLVAANSSALGTGGWNGATMTWIRNGATLALHGGVSLNEHLHLLGSGVGGHGALRSMSGNNALTLPHGGSGSGPGFCLDGDTTVGVDADMLTVTGFYQDAGSFGLTKVGNGTLHISGTNNYTGDTTVNAGTLRLGNGSNHSNLTDAADVIVATGATLHLDYTGTDTIYELSLGGLRKSPGVYSSNNSNGFLTGSGTLTVTSGPPSDFDFWAESHNLEGDSLGDDDHDNLTNFTEYAFGLDPKNSGSSNPYLSYPQSGTGAFTYTRRKTSLSGLTFKVWRSADLTSWSEDIEAIQSIIGFSGDSEIVEVTLSPPLHTNNSLFVRISTRSN